MTDVQFKIVQEGVHQENLTDVDPAIIRSNVEQAIDAGIDLDIRVSFNDSNFTECVDPIRVAKAEVYRERTTEYPFPPCPPPLENASEDYRRGIGPDEFGLSQIMAEIREASKVSVFQRCFKPFSFAYINYAAEMGTCNHMMYPFLLKMGDLKTQTLGEIWNSPAYQDFRRQLLEAKPQDGRCQWCFKHRLDD